jgi:polar amino acid transport system permease protein
LGLDIRVLWTPPYGGWLIEGTLTTLHLTGVAIVCSTVLAIVLSMMRMSTLRLFSWPARAYVYFFRNTPFPVQMLFWYFGTPYLLPAALMERLYAGDFEFQAALIALVLYTAAYIAEHFRSGISAIPKSQMESALSSGMSFIQAMSYVILPQAFRISLPPLISEYLTIAKNSSVAMIIGVAEAMTMARRIESYSFKAFEAFGAVTLLYLSLSLLTSLVLNWYNRHYLAVIEAEDSGKRKRRRPPAFGKKGLGWAGPP